MNIPSVLTPTNGTCVCLLVASLLLASAPFANAQVLPNSQLAEPPTPPPGFLPPPLNPTGVVLETRQLADGVYALMSNTPFTDNAGFVVGKDAVLVIDSHFNGGMAEQIIQAVRAITDLPIRYLLNTNAFGDHVFGNFVFPKDTQIVAHQSTIDALAVSSVAGMAQTMARTVGGDLSVFDGVQLRLPNIGFEDSWSVDLGGIIVEMYWFGPGMSPNDSVVYLPAEKIAWTANLVFGKGTIPWARSGDISTYQTTLDNFADTIKPTIIVPGHGNIVSGDLLNSYRQYLAEVVAQASTAAADGRTVDDLVNNAEINKEYEITASLKQLMTGFHRWNLKAAYKEAQQSSISTL